MNIDFIDKKIGPYRISFVKNTIVTDQHIINKLNERHPDKFFDNIIVICRGIWISKCLDGEMFDPPIEVMSYDVYYELII